MNIEALIEDAIASVLGPMVNEPIPLEPRTGRPTEVWWRSIAHRLTSTIVGTSDMHAVSSVGNDGTRFGVEAGGQIVLFLLRFDRPTATLLVDRVSADDPQDWLDRGDERRAAEGKERAEYERLRAKFGA